MIAVADLLRAIDDSERGPGPGELDGAPLLTDWWLSLEDRVVVRAHGDVTGHPKIRDPFVTTSPVIGFDPDAGWMRTRSRWYRLGPPANRAHIDVTKEAVQKLMAAIRARAREAHGDLE